MSIEPGQFAIYTQTGRGRPHKWLLEGDVVYVGTKCARRKADAPDIDMWHVAARTMAGDVAWTKISSGRLQPATCEQQVVIGMSIRDAASRPA